MLKWFITKDWNTPLKEKEWQGEAKDQKAVCKAVKAWIDKHMPQFSDREIWRFVALADGSGTIIDFGSYTVFAKFAGAECKEEDKK